MPPPLLTPPLTPPPPSAPKSNPIFQNQNVERKEIEREGLKGIEFSLRGHAFTVGILALCMGMRRAYTLPLLGVIYFFWHGGGYDKIL